MRSDPRLRVAGIVLIGGLLGTALYGWLRPGAPAEDAAGARGASSSDDFRERLESLGAEIADLKIALDEERSLRGALEIEMALLRRELGADASADRHAAASPEPKAGTGAGRREGTAADPAAVREAVDAMQRVWFDAAALRERGIDERRAERLRERSEELQMAELYLRDQARREGWIGRPRYLMQLQSMRKESREALGVEDYDLMLYATGRNNRVLVRDVLQNSPAAAAGIASGDLVLRYDDATILSPSDLNAATSQGESGANVAVDVLRDGSPRRFYLPRGPLGVQIQGVRRFPSQTP